MKLNTYLFFIFIVFIGVLFIQCPTQRSGGGGGSGGGSDGDSSDPSTNQILGVYDDTFNAGSSGANDRIYATAIQSDGKIIIGGTFTTYNGVNVPDGIIRLNANGSIDTTFNNGGSGIDNIVYALAIQSDGKILVGGVFDTYNGINVPDGIMRLNTNGSIDVSFNNGGSGLSSGGISVIKIQSDGKILIGGGVAFYNGIDVPNFIVRLNSDGSVDSTFNSVGSGADNTVYTIAVQSDGKILIGGEFTGYNGISVPFGIIRLYSNGSPDTTFNNGGVGANVNNYITAIAVQTDGKILIGGDFSIYNNLDVPDRLIRLNSNGTIDTAFNNSGSGINGIVNGIAIQSDGKILVVGNFSAYNNDFNVCDYIVRLNTGGSVDTTFNTSGIGADSIVYSTIIQPDGKILIGGNFTIYNLNNVPDRVIRLK